MDELHRKILLENIEVLVKFTNYESLLERCISEGIVSEIMKENLLSSSYDPKTQHAELLRKITKRGPTAYNTLINICHDLGFEEASILLKNDNSGVLKSINGSKYSHLRDLAVPTPNPDHTVFRLSRRSLHNATVADSATHIDSRASINIGIAKNFYTELEIYGADTPLKKINIKVRKSRKIHSDNKVANYKMKSRNRGVAFLVNIVDFPSRSDSEKVRNGAIVDRDNLVYLFREFGFDVFYYENLTLKEFYRLLGMLLLSEYTKRTESFVMSLMTHGEMKGGQERVEFHDGSIVLIEEIVDRFRNSDCKNLVGKPKIFIFPFCRGEISDRGMKQNYSAKGRIETDGTSEVHTSTYSDILICYATIPGFKTHRDPDKGSWYIQVLCEVWAEHAHDTHVEDLLKLVGQRTQKIITDDDRMQTSSKTDYGFNKKLFFNPGYHEET